MENAQHSIVRTNCPECAAAIPSYPGYVIWCSQCNWNLKPNRSAEPRNLFEKLYLRAGLKSSESLLNSMIGKEIPTSRFSIMKLLTYALSSCVYIISVGFFAIGCIAITVFFPGPLAILTGILFILLGLIARPKWYKPETAPISREQLPVLYQTIDDLSSVLRTRKVAGVILNGEYNAGYAEIGMRSRSILELGLPLVSILDRQELTALIAHELAHGINGDSRRGFFVNSAIRTLITWHKIITPDRLFNTEEYNLMMAIAMVVPNSLMLLLSKTVELWLFVICHLNWHDSQRAEYLADRCAASAANKDAVIRLLHKTSFGQLFEFAVLKSINTKKTGDLIGQFQQFVKEVPESELERIKRVNLLDGSRLNVTHPPTANRISYISALDSAVPLYRMTDETHRLIMDELSNLAAPIEAKIIDDTKSYALGY